MMRFAPVPQHPDWSAEAEAPGRAWLAANPGAERPRDCWTGRDQKFNRHLRDGFHGLCGYTAMWTPLGTVDHFVPWASLRGTPQEPLAYDWANLRYSVGWFNSSRKSATIPDPYIVNDDWFELLVPSLELRATAQVPTSCLPAVQQALRWLGTDRRVMDVRQEYFRDYQRGEIAFSYLERRAPLIARALIKNPGYLRPADQRRLRRSGAIP